LPSSPPRVQSCGTLGVKGVQPVSTGPANHSVSPQAFASLHTYAASAMWCSMISMGNRDIAFCSAGVTLCQAALLQPCGGLCCSSARHLPDSFRAQQCGPAVECESATATAAAEDRIGRYTSPVCCAGTQPACGHLMQVGYFLRCVHAWLYSTWCTVIR
jgi:hypothetical protein